jgi:hypothetical protein
MEFCSADTLRCAGIEYPSPYATAGRKRRPEGAPRDRMQCAVLPEDCYIVIPPTRGRTDGIVFRVDF